MYRWLLMILLVAWYGVNNLYAQKESDHRSKEQVADSTQFRLFFESGVLRVESPYEADVDLFNLLGQRRASYKVPKGESRHYVGNLPVGCYLVTVTGRGKRTSVRVILD